MSALTKGQFMHKVCLAIILCSIALNANPVNKVRKDLNDLDNTRNLLTDLESFKEIVALQDLDENKFKRQTSESERMVPFDADLIRSLLEQGNNLIAASAVSETPVPLRLMRLSKNSGLRR